MDSNKRSNPYLNMLASKKQKVNPTLSGPEQISGRSSQSEGYSILEGSSKGILSSQLSKILSHQPNLNTPNTTAQQTLMTKLAIKDKEQEPKEKEDNKQHNKPKDKTNDRIAILKGIIHKNKMIEQCLNSIQKNNRVMFPEQSKHPFIVFSKNPDEFGNLLDILALFYHVIETPLHNNIVKSTNRNSDIQPKQKRMVVGFDCEFIGDDSVIGNKKAATIQLSTWKLCIIFWVATLDELPECLEKVLQSKKILKVGVNSHEDAMTVTYSFGCPVDGVVDINYVSLQLGYADSFLKLGELAKIFIQDDKVNVGAHQKSWKSDEPTHAQIRYAGHDAWLGFAILQKFYQNAITTSQGVAETMHKLVKKQVDNAIDQDVDMEAQKTFYHWAKPWNLTQEERDHLQKDLSKTTNKGTFQAVASMQQKLVKDESEIFNLVKNLSKKVDEQTQIKPEKTKKQKREKQQSKPKDFEEISLDLNLHIA